MSGLANTSRDLRGAAPTLGLLLGVVLLALTAWEHQSAAGRSADAAALLAECQQLGQRILSARGGPARAEEQRRTADDLAGQIEGWFRSAGVAATQILRIEPIAPRRLKESSYLEQGARVELRALTLAQLAGFAQEVAEADPRLSITSLRVTAPRVETQAGDETWQAELALTYLLYAPKSSR